MQIILGILATLSILTLTTAGWADNPSRGPAAALEMLDQGYQIAQKIMSDQTKASALCNIAQAMAKAGERDRALKIFKEAVGLIENIKPEHPDQPENFIQLKLGKASALRDIATVQASLGESPSSTPLFARAIQLIEELPDGQTKIEALRDIAISQIKAKEPTAADRTLTKAFGLIDSQKSSSVGNSKYNKILLLTSLARVQAEMGDRAAALERIQRALDEAGTIQEPWPRAQSYREIALIQGRVGEDKEAILNLQKILQLRDQKPDKNRFKSISYNSMDLLYLAEALIEGGNPNAAKPMIESAAKSIQTIPDEYYRSAAWRTYAIVESKLGEVKAALAADTEINEESFRGVALPYIVEALIRTGHLDEARKLVNARGDESPLGKGVLLKELAIAQAHQGDIKNALKTIDLIPSTEGDLIRANGIRGIAAALVEVEELRVASNWALSQNSATEKVYALLGIVDKLLSTKAKTVNLCISSSSRV